MITNIPMEKKSRTEIHQHPPVVPLVSEETVRVLERKFIEFLKTGNIPDGLFADDVFLDFTVPLWRLQASGVQDAVALRRSGHPCAGKVPRWRTDRTDTGFVMEFEEVWVDGGQQWYCREMARADVADNAISALSVYCTGDWDAARQARHAQKEVMLRP
ncbi:hypothetical protein QF031_002115 [Pseudarthrobacter defluvii]|uniref:hypothetical protein n=1 Tax=Pseudarthrobacter defluvii TaxID=410837 RepID=UPI00278A7F01|nr:hypothetical protein [Pseudarthrobacter defluvii]MDQ0769366.1 hypothetical protein [Pseudarthrobacter defluvii]